MTSRATKKMRAVPKSLHQGQAAHTEAAEEDGKDQVCWAKSRSRVAAPVKMKAIFTNSEG